MIPAGVFLASLLLFAIGGLLVWLAEVRHARAEQAFWRQLDTRPALYDWATEEDLAE